MTDAQFEKIKKGLNFHSEGGIDNLCMMTETSLRAILDDATKELEAGNQKWKDEWQEQVQKATDEGYERTLQTIQLTKAKELLQFVSEYEDMTCYADELEEIKQFLSEVEK